MPVYRIHRLRKHARDAFRLSPHTSGRTPLKPKDYEPGEEVDAPTPYAAWALLRGSSCALDVGDVLVAEDGGLFICKYVGFEEAFWVLPAPAAAAPA